MITPTGHVFGETDAFGYAQCGACGLVRLVRAP